MAIQFPANPQLNATFNYDDKTYIWDGEKWTASAIGSFDDVYVNVTGDTMTGDLVIDGANLSATDGTFSGVFQASSGAGPHFMRRTGTGAIVTFQSGATPSSKVVIQDDSVKIGGDLGADDSPNIRLNADGSASFADKVTSASTEATDGGTTLVTKDYLTGGGSGGTGTLGYWNRTGTDLSPVNAGDNVDLGTGDLSAAAGTFAGGKTLITDDTQLEFHEGNFGTHVDSNRVLFTRDIAHMSGAVPYGTLAGRVFDGAAYNDACSIKFERDDPASGFGTDGAIKFETNNANAGNSEKMRLSREGNLKIGGSLPNSPNITLDANGEVRINRAASGSVTIPVSILNGLVGVLQVRPDGTTNIGGSLPNSPNISLQADGLIRSVPTYNNTSSSPNDVGISSGGAFYRSTSSIRFKTDVETIEYQYSDAILGCRPVYYRSTCEMDDPSLSHWGFIAEEVGEIDPRLVKWSEKEDGTKQADGVAYDRFVPHLVNLIKRQNTRIEALEAEVQALKGGS